MHKLPRDKLCELIKREGKSLTKYLARIQEIESVQLQLDEKTKHVAELQKVAKDEEQRLSQLEKVREERQLKELANSSKRIFRDRLKDGGFGPEMIIIPAGRFQMGDIQGDFDERPAHWVEIKPFAMGRYEVTFAEYDRFAEATGRTKPEDENWGRDNRPVINVSWHDANHYGENPIFIFDPKNKDNQLPNEPDYDTARQRWSYCPAPLQTLFIRAFTEGLHNPAQRIMEGECIGEMVQNPQNPKVWGIRNLSEKAWTATFPDASKKSVEPQRAAPLKLGLKLNISGTEAEIVA